jgi:vanillate O-demethylase ferredoxin subunit
MAEASLRVFIKSITFEADRISSYVLHPANGDCLPAFTAGAHIDLHLHEGTIRSYSLINDQTERHRYVIAVKREEAGRGGSAYVHDKLRVGDALTISGPRNNFAFDEAGQYSVFVAGGIGITPIVSMITRAAALRRPWTLHYASRTRRDAAFLADIEALAQTSGGEINAVFDQEDGGGALDIPAIVSSAPGDAHLYCCGPLPMLEAFKQAASCRPPRTVHLEYFSPREEAATAGGFDVHLQKSSRTISVAPGQTILAALLDARVDVAYACSEGTCGTCETRVIQGIPDHRDVYLSDEERAENKQIMICCSGAKTPVLVLDL